MLCRYRVTLTTYFVLGIYSLYHIILDYRRLYHTILECTYTPNKHPNSRASLVQKPG